MAIAIFGGAFNPPHDEHINIIKNLFLEGIEEVVIIPSKNPPHKNFSETFTDRVNMLYLALLSIKNVVIDEIENEDNEIHYSIDIIKKIKQKYNKDVVFVMGGDSLIDFYKWKNPELIIKECPIWVYKRGQNAQFNEAVDKWTKLGATIKILSYEPKEISSSYIRANIALGFFENIDKKVQRYIYENNLYSKYDEYIVKLSKIIKEERFAHSLYVAKYALYLNDRHHLNLDIEKVLLSGLLHDCAKGYYQENMQDKSMIPKDCIGTKIEHQFLGAYIAQKEFSINDEDMLNSIRYHSTGRENMSTLEKLIYSADLLEETREDEFLIDLRKIMDEDFEKGFLAIVENQLNYLKSSQADIYPLTIKAAKYYIGE